MGSIKCLLDTARDAFRCYRQAELRLDCSKGTTRQAYS